MNANRFTQKSLEAIQGAQQFADANRNTQVEQVHLLKALIDDKDDLNTQLLSSMQVDVPALRTAVDRAIDTLLTYSGDGQQAGATAGISRAIAEADAHRPTFTAIPLILIFGNGFSFLTSNDDSRVNPSRLLSYCTFISSSFIPIPPLLSNFTRKSRKT